MTRIVAAVVAILALAVATLLLANYRLNTSLETSEAVTAAWQHEALTYRLVMDSYQARYVADQEALAKLDKKIKELKAYAEKLPDRDRECLSADDTGELRKLWQD